MRLEAVVPRDAVHGGHGHPHPLRRSPHRPVPGVCRRRRHREVDRGLYPVLLNRLLPRRARAVPKKTVDALRGKAVRPAPHRTLRHAGFPPVSLSPVLPAVRNGGGKTMSLPENGILCLEQNTSASNKLEVFHIFPRRENFLHSAVRCHFQPPAFPQLPDLLHGHLASKAVVSRFDLVTDMALESTGETDCASAMLFSQGTPQLKPFLLSIS